MSWLRSLFWGERASWGVELVGPVSVVIAFACHPESSWMLVIGCLGLFLSSRGGLRGFGYALALLILGGGVVHLGWIVSHAWQLSVELVYGVSFFLTALVREEKEAQEQEWLGSLEAKDATLLGLEEETKKGLQEREQERISWQEKVENLQKELEEARGEESSLTTLNEVLRLASKDLVEKVEELRNRSAHETTLSSQLQRERDLLEREKLSWQEGVASLRIEKLHQELGQMAQGKEQMRLIGEAIAKEHAVDQRRLQEALLQVKLLREENRRLSLLAEEGKALSLHMAALEKEREVHRQTEMSLAAIKEERNHLQERVKKADFSREAAKSPIEPLYRQLKEQFEKKNEILHETRGALFRAETELASLQKEKEEWGMTTDPLAQDLLGELARLEEENASLQKIIGDLSKG